ncbi:aminotransferase-like domain-containing protein [Rubrivivax albus]|uniref:PLP-dependent aminotransferase family protein n=1 Tax=Rubrivivax albus TaxID=2499835 RepID=A0A437JWJ7_9BURK|nr:PLP-dependent aminotransferase family protein [Rubrivivax albus]RVT51670.1 PLP-dependent aminotransferase family protein [Rubrivivax albus]
MHATQENLSRSAGATLAEQLAARFGERIGQGLLRPGARLPSVRDCAARYGVSPATVVAAYDRLQAQGLVQAQAQRGFYVRQPAGTARAARTGASAGSAAGGGPTAPVDATALIRGMFHAGVHGSAPGMGTLPVDWLDAALLQRAVRRVTSGTAGDGEAWLRYGEPAGDPALRAALSRRLADMGVDAGPEQIVTTVGATHALDLVARTLLQPGDAVLVDEPGWAVEYERLTRLGMRLLPVPRTADGPDLDVMAALLQAHRPRLYVTVSVLHNPTGHTLSPAAAHRVLGLAEQHDLTVVEDDTYAFFAPPHATRMAALDGLRRTLLVSGFSKILAPQWRVGFVAAPPALAERLIDTKLVGTLTTPALLEQAVAWCLDQGLLRRHAERIVQRLDTARERAVRHALAAGCRFVAPPQGLFGWVDVGTDTERLALAMLDQGWLLAPGTLFQASRRPSTCMRINFAATQDGRFWQALKASSPHAHRAASNDS